MMAGSLWLTRMILSHLLTDFILQPTNWVEDRNRKHFASSKLYWHGLTTAVVAYILAGWQYWSIALIILVTHTLIDGWKSYRPQLARYFLIDQLLHLMVILGCWLLAFHDWGFVGSFWQKIRTDQHYWIILTAFVFLTSPAGILIGQLTKQWSKKIDDPENSLANAGKWIGIAERTVVLILVLHQQYSAIGLLIAAKGIIRFNEKDRQEVKTEYLVIGTLVSIGIAILTGLAVKKLG
jgi:uncharacterized protein DUF3307